MNDAATPAPKPRLAAPSETASSGCFCPWSAFVAAIGWLVLADPLSGFRNGAPPVENITYERTHPRSVPASTSSCAAAVRSR